MPAEEQRDPEFEVVVSDDLADRAEQDPTLHAALNALARVLQFDDGAS